MDGITAGVSVRIAEEFHLPNEVNHYISGPKDAHCSATPWSADHLFPLISLRLQMQ